MAASLLPAVSANAPAVAIAAESAASQLSLLATITPPRTKLNRGSASTPPTPKPLSVGPTARTTIRRSAVPLSTKPGIGEPATPPTAARVAMFTSRAVPVVPSSASAAKGPRTAKTR